MTRPEVRRLAAANLLTQIEENSQPLSDLVRLARHWLERR